jgi:hypothetical protein
MEGRRSEPHQLVSRACSPRWKLARKLACGCADFAMRASREIGCHAAEVDRASLIRRSVGRGGDRCDVGVGARQQLGEVVTQRGWMPLVVGLGERDAQKRAVRAWRAAAPAAASHAPLRRGARPANDD